MWKDKFRFIIFALSLLAITACEEESNKDNVNHNEISRIRKAPEFQADSAYAYIETQLAFGPRTPNSSGHHNCGNWLIEKFKSYSSNVHVQGANLRAYDGTMLQARNIIASFNPEDKRRIMITAHWDTRPWADNDVDISVHDQAIPGANDGGSGVAVILEIARQLAIKSPQIGVDLFLWDAEDYGVSDARIEDSYCLGAQYWAKKKHLPNYEAHYAINLDMVGAEGAQFTKEGFSRRYASQVLNKVWGIGAELGYANYFLNLDDSPITDDHYYVNYIAQIPAIDIIDRDPNKDSFFEHWHTMKDDIDAISRETLKAVGQTVLEVIYREE